MASFIGGAGLDRVSYFNIGAVINLDLMLQGAAQDTGGGGFDSLISIENISGTAFDDIIRGDDNANQINANNGNDLVEGRGGDDILVGDADARTMAVCETIMLEASTSRLAASSGGSCAPSHARACARSICPIAEQILCEIGGPKNYALPAGDHDARMAPTPLIGTRLRRQRPDEEEQ